MTREEDVHVPISLLSDYTTPLTSVEFEKLVMECMLELGNGLTELKVTHNQKIEAEDGLYQIDVYATFKAMGVEMKVIAECKQYASPVKREKVAVLHDKSRALGAHKGIMFSTASYQKGAIQYAIIHGIALVRILPRGAQFLTNYMGGSPMTYEQYTNAPNLVAECIYGRTYTLLKGKNVLGVEQYLRDPSVVQ
jgi:hypothetical protein